MALYDAVVERMGASAVRSTQTRGSDQICVPYTSRPRRAGSARCQAAAASARSSHGVAADPAAVGGAVLAYVSIDSTAWMGDSADQFAAIPEIVEAHIVAGSATVLAKVRTATTEQLQDVLRRLYTIEGVSGTQATVVLETFFERPVSPLVAE